MTTDIHNMDNMLYEPYKKFDVIYADYIYEDENFNWVEKFWKYMKPNSIFIAQTDWHTNHRYRVFVEDVCGGIIVNDAVLKAEWGNHPRNKFHQCFDNIIIYSNSNKWIFHPEKIQVPKVTKTKGLNPSGRETKQATAWIDDCTLTTTALERVKKDDGHLIRWQKPLKLFDRIISPFVDDEHNEIFDPFGGTFSLGLWCKKNNMNYTGIEYDEEVFRYGKQNIFGGNNG